MIVKSAPGSNKTFRLSTNTFVEGPNINFDEVHTSPKKAVANNIHFKYKGNWYNGLSSHLHNITHLYPPDFTQQINNVNNPIDLGEYNYHEPATYMHTGALRQTSPRLEELQQPVIRPISHFMAGHILSNIPDHPMINDYLDEFPDKVKQLVPNIEEIPNAQKAHVLLSNALTFATNEAYRNHAMHHRRTGRAMYNANPQVFINDLKKYPIKDDVLKAFLNSAANHLQSHYSNSRQKEQYNRYASYPGHTLIIEHAANSYYPHL